MLTNGEGQLCEALYRARAGDQASLERLLRQLHTPLHRFAYRHVRSEPEAGELARDLTQDALLRIARRVDQCHAGTDAKLLAWALATMRNLCMDHYRATRCRIPHVRLSVELEEVIEELPSALGRHSQTTPSASRGARILQRVIRQTVRALPRPARHLLRLRLWKEKTWPEVGSELGLAPSAAKRRYQRMQTLLRRQILDSIEVLPERERRAALSFLRFPST